MSVEWLRTEKRISETLTDVRTRHVTQQFIVMQGALRPAVTQVVAMYTDHRPSAPIEPRAHKFLTPLLIFKTNAVVHPIATCIQWKAVTDLTRATIMGVWTRIVMIHLFRRERTYTIKVDQNG
ncbi:hypothetical protein ACOMHN_050329 [Nucella lapillus]